jgi:hypothetical protein
MYQLQQCKKKYLILAFLPIICFMIYIDLVLSSINELREEKEQTIVQLNIKRNVYIQSCINKRIIQARQQNEFLSDYYKKSDYSNILLTSDTQDQILSSIIIYDKQLSNLYQRYNSDHILFISNIAGIVSVSANNNIKFTDWGTIKLSKNNYLLTNSTINTLLSDSSIDKVLIWESDIATKNNIYNPLYTDSNIETLYNVLANNDFINYSYYDILIPTYIIDNCNINSWNFIIIREINLYEALLYYKASIDKYDTTITAYNDDVYHILYIQFLFSIVNSLLLFASILLGYKIFISHYKSKSW